jgi:hypothetical protein
MLVGVVAESRVKVFAVVPSSFFRVFVVPLMLLSPMWATSSNAT